MAMKSGLSYIEPLRALQLTITFESLSFPSWTIDLLFSIAVHFSLVHTTASPVCNSLGSASTLNLMAMTFESIRYPLSLGASLLGLEAAGAGPAYETAPNLL